MSLGNTIKKLDEQDAATEAKVLAEREARRALKLLRPARGGTHSLLPANKHPPRPAVVTPGVLPQCKVHKWQLAGLGRWTCKKCDAIRAWPQHKLAG